jgi:hypothetical protein
MSRIPLDHKPTPLLRIAEIYSKRRYGAVLEPGLGSAQAASANPYRTTHAHGGSIR